MASRKASMRARWTGAKPPSEARLEVGKSVIHERLASRVQPLRGQPPPEPLLDEPTDGAPDELLAVLGVVRKCGEELLRARAGFGLQLGLRHHRIEPLPIEIEEALPERLERHRVTELPDRA